MKRFVLNLILVLIVPISAYSQTLTRAKIGPVVGWSQVFIENVKGQFPAYSYGGFLVLDRVGVEIKRIQPFNHKFKKLESENIYTDYDGTSYSLSYNLYTGSGVCFSYGGGVFVGDYDYVRIPLTPQTGRQISYYFTFDTMVDIKENKGLSLGVEWGEYYKGFNLGFYLNL